MNSYTNVHLYDGDEPYPVYASKGEDVFGTLDFGNHVKVFVSPGALLLLADAVERLRKEMQARAKANEVPHANP